MDCLRHSKAVVRTDGWELLCVHRVKVHCCSWTAQPLRVLLCLPPWGEDAVGSTFAFTHSRQPYFSQTACFQKKLFAYFLNCLLFSENRGEFFSWKMLASHTTCMWIPIWQFSTMKWLVWRMWGEQRMLQIFSPILTKDDEQIQASGVARCQIGTKWLIKVSMLTRKMPR